MCWNCRLPTSRARCGRAAPNAWWLSGPPAPGPNTPPSFNSQTPQDDVKGITNQLASLQVNISESDGDLINWTIECSNGDTTSAHNDTNSTKLLTFSAPLAYNTTYYWYVNASDGTSWTREYYHFTTNAQPGIMNPSPVSGSTNQNLRHPLQITIYDFNADTMNVTFSTNVTGTWATIETNSSVGNGTYQCTNESMNRHRTKYYWKISINDGIGGWTNATYSFTTKAETIRPSTEHNQTTTGSSNEPTAPQPTLIPGFEMSTALLSFFICVFVYLKKK